MQPALGRRQPPLPQPPPCTPKGVERRTQQGQKLQQAQGRVRTTRPARKLTRPRYGPRPSCGRAFPVKTWPRQPPGMRARTRRSLVQRLWPQLRALARARRSRSRRWTWKQQRQHTRPLLLTMATRPTKMTPGRQAELEQAQQTVGQQPVERRFLRPPPLHRGAVIAQRPMPMVGRHDGMRSGCPVPLIVITMVGCKAVLHSLIRCNDAAGRGTACATASRACSL
mmetsp:Transcript_26889/g.72507  ORF Transcript_26889/g.72507 Transcript_26889/m.72507 type:complete len:225 (-) Transcript_26889:156-830(-)